MATLAESFLADLEELDDEGEFEADEAGAAGAAPSGIGLADALNYDDLDSVAPLVHSERYRSILQVRLAVLATCVASSPNACCATQRVDEALQKGDQPRVRSGPVDEDPEYKVRNAAAPLSLAALTRALLHTADCGLQRAHGRHRQRDCARAQLHSRQVRPRCACAAAARP